MRAPIPPAVQLRSRQRSWRIDPTRLRSLAAQVLAGEGADLEMGVGIVLVRDPAIATLNRRFLGHSGPTDVLSFPTDPRGWPPGEPRPLGEVVVSVDRAREQALERGLKPRVELERLIVHGILHLLGYDDATPGERARMRRRENRYLAASRTGAGRGSSKGR
jgi:probable rRNA maturation factor